MRQVFRVAIAAVAAGAAGAALGDVAGDQVVGQRQGAAGQVDAAARRAAAGAAVAAGPPVGWPEVAEWPL